MPQALEQYEAMLQLPGAEVQALVGKAHVLAVCGRVKEARECLDRLHVLARERYVSAYFFAEIHAGLGETEEAIRWLDRRRRRTRSPDDLAPGQSEVRPTARARGLPGNRPSHGPLELPTVQ